MPISQVLTGLPDLAANAIILQQGQSNRDSDRFRHPGMDQLRHSGRRAKFDVHGLQNETSAGPKSCARFRFFANFKQTFLYCRGESEEDAPLAEL